MNKLGINETEKCHQMGCKQQNKSCPRTIVCCFSKLKEKRFGRCKQVKSTPIHICQNLSKDTM